MVFPSSCGLTVAWGGVKSEKKLTGGEAMMERSPHPEIKYTTI